MSQLILHHYVPSPVSEKIRTALGIKDMTWQSCEQNRLPDRPELFAMTGGYRRIPVMQIGADLYCDTQCIFRELESRWPEPTLFPGGGRGMPFAVSRWTDGELFASAFRIAFAPVADDLPPALVTDRQRLYIGAGGDLKKEMADLPHTLAQFRAQVGWLEERLESNRAYILGENPSMADLLAWFIVWFVKERYAEAGEFFAEFPRLNAWAERMAAIGHGTSSPISPAEALSVARDSTPQTAEQADPRDPQGLKPGMQATVEPLTDSAEKPVSGTIRAVARDTIALTRETQECGEVAIHFPRVGYRVTVL